MDMAGGGRKEKVGYMERVTQKHTLPYVNYIANGNLQMIQGTQTWAL